MECVHWQRDPLSLRPYSFSQHPAFSQPAVAGIVRDTSGAVLPASPSRRRARRSSKSPERRHRRGRPIPDRRSGTGHLRRDVHAARSAGQARGHRVTGAGATTINADLRVGAVEETVTVTGATPIVDTQTSTTRQVVLSNAVLAVAPISRTYGNVLAMVPAVQSLTLDPNSTQSADRDRHELLLHVAGRAWRKRRHGAGGRHERRVGVRRRRRLELCLRFRERAGGPGHRRRRYGREWTAAGRRFNIIPKTGGNLFAGTAFGSTRPASGRKGATSTMSCAAPASPSSRS